LSGIRCNKNGNALLKERPADKKISKKTFSCRAVSSGGAASFRGAAGREGSRPEPGLSAGRGPPIAMTSRALIDFYPYRDTVFQ
jgi:hypothetical protein